MRHAFGMAVVAGWALLATQQVARAYYITLDFTVSEPVSMDVNGLAYSEDGFQIWANNSVAPAASEIRPTFGGSWFMYAEEAFGVSFTVTHETSTFNFRSFDVLALAQDGLVAFQSEWGYVSVTGGSLDISTGAYTPGDGPGTYAVNGWEWSGLSWLRVHFYDYSWVGSFGTHVFIDNIVLFVPSPSVAIVAYMWFALTCKRGRRVGWPAAN